MYLKCEKLMIRSQQKSLKNNFFFCGHFHQHNDKLLFGPYSFVKEFLICHRRRNPFSTLLFLWYRKNKKIIKLSVFIILIFFFTLIKQNILIHSTNNVQTESSKSNENWWKSALFRLTHVHSFIIIYYFIILSNTKYHIQGYIWGIFAYILDKNIFFILQNAELVFPISQKTKIFSLSSVYKGMRIKIWVKEKKIFNK